MAQPNPNPSPETPAGKTGGTIRRVVIDSGKKPNRSGQQNQQRPPQQGGKRRRRRRSTSAPTATNVAKPVVTDSHQVKIPLGASVKEVAEHLQIPVAEAIKRLMQLGEMVTVNQSLPEEVVVMLAETAEKEIEFVSLAEELAEAEEIESATGIARPPVVTIMGHVDHGKTSLLDAIRSTEVVEGEAGGITQHIGAYQVHHNQELVTFIDTPGHEAFTAMRARGAHVTDVAVIVVAADDGVMPQTEEAISHAQAAEVPIVVAVNKIDKDGADPLRVRTDLSSRGLQPEEWGGDTIYVDVSAKQRINLDELLDTILLVAEIEELQADPDVDASGVVIESKLDTGRGPVATVLVQQGTLCVGSALVAGAHFGRIRAMHDYLGRDVDSAPPSTPVEVLGFQTVPHAGESVRFMENEKQARALAESRAHRLRVESLARRDTPNMSLAEFSKRIAGMEDKILNVLIKSDVMGSMEAIEDAIAKLPQEEVKVYSIHRGIGGITESDVMLAAASGATILGFNVRPVGEAAAVASREHVEIRNYSVIYRALEDLRAAMEGMLDPTQVDSVLGSAEVRQLFRASKAGIIAGSAVKDGAIQRGNRVRLIRDGTVVHEGVISSLRRGSDDAREVAAGFECGITLDNFQDIKEGDIIEAFTIREEKRELANA